MFTFSVRGKKVFQLQVVCVASLLLLPVSLFADDMVKTLTGDVVVLEEDESGKVISVALSVETEEDYQQINVVMNNKGKELVDELYNTVKVSGKVSVDDDQEWITINKWERISLPETDDDDLYEDDQNSDEDIEYSDE